MEEVKICQNCNFFKQPKCTVKNEFKARKTESCDDYKVSKKKKMKTSNKKNENEKSEMELKADILGYKLNAPEKPKMKRSKTQRRK